MLTELSNLKIKIGDVVARNPDEVYPVYCKGDLIRWTGIYEVLRIQRDDGYICISGQGENIYKRLEGKPIWRHEEVQEERDRFKEDSPTVKEAIEKFKAN